MKQSSGVRKPGEQQEIDLSETEIATGISRPSALAECWTQISISENVWFLSFLNF